MKGIHVRRATPADRERVETAVRECGRFVRTYFGLFSLDKHYDEGHVWLAEREGSEKVLGFAVAVPLKRTHVTSLYEFGVVPEAEGQGLGQHMLEIVRVGRPLRFVIDHRNTAALAFYRACGLEPNTPEPQPTKPGSKNIVWRVEGVPTPPHGTGKETP